MNAVPAPLVRGLSVLLFALAGGVLWFGFKRLRRTFRDGDLGSAATFGPAFLMLIPAIVAFFWLDVSPGAEARIASLFTKGTVEAAALPETTDVELGRTLAGFFVLFAAGTLLFTIGRFLRGQDLRSRPMEGFGGAIVMAAGLMVGGRSC